MNSSELVAMTTRNISNALRDYKAHTSPTSVLNNVSDCFIERLAIDGIAAIKELAPKVYRSNKKKSCV